jgi:Fur family transcriptional regulator, peroxide stress response regulator
MNAERLIVKNRLLEKGLKVTPQRLAILEAIYSLNNHPTAESITEFIREEHPNIAIGTVYKVLNTLVDHSLVKRVKTESDSMRYDGILDQHHHLYCADSDRIEDYHDEELDHLLVNYFKDRRIPGFQIEEVKLQIKGRFAKDQIVRR